MLTLILKENSFRFNGKNYLQIYDTAMDTKMAVAFANIFMANIRTQILSESVAEPMVWKRYFGDVISLRTETCRRLCNSFMRVCPKQGLNLS